MTSFDIIQGTPSSCASDTRILAMKKSTLDYHTKNIVNSITPAKLKVLELDYETNKKKYDASPCGKDTKRGRCIDLEQQIESLRSSIVYFKKVRNTQSENNTKANLDKLVKEFEDTKCAGKISEFKAEIIGGITDSFSEMDKARIEGESKYQAKQKIFFGAIILIGAVLIITIFGKNK
jgi:hypothetical protein